MFCSLRIRFISGSGSGWPKSPKFRQLRLPSNARAHSIWPNFGHPVPTLSFYGCALWRCCRQATKIINHRSKADRAERISIRTMEKLFFTCEIYIFVNDEVWAGCPKIGHANLLISRSGTPSITLINLFSCWREAAGPACCWSVSPSPSPGASPSSLPTSRDTKLVLIPVWAEMSSRTALTCHGGMKT